MIDVKGIKRGDISARTIKNGAGKSLLLVSQNDAVFMAFLALVFLSLGLAGILNHEMWRDELKAWVIARDSSSIIDLFHNFRGEAHPCLWYLCLYILSRLTHNPVAMQLFHLMLATGVVLLFTGFSPFTRLQKILFCFGYFPFYEYAVVSRNYALGVLLVFAFCALFNKPDKNPFILFCVLTLLANTNLYSLIIAIPLGLILLFDTVGSRKTKSLFQRKWTILGLFIFICGVVGAIIQIIPPSYDTPGKVMSTPPFHSYRAVASVMTVWESYVPLPNVFIHSFWNTNILMAVPHGWTLGFLLSLGLLVLLTVLFIRKPIVLFLYLFGTLGILTFTFTKIIGGARHWGHLFILLVVCFWISGQYTELKLKWLGPTLAQAIDLVAKHKNKFITAILAVHLIAGIYAMSMDLFYPFSGSKPAAIFIQEQQMTNMRIVAGSDNVASALSAYLDRKIYISQSTTPQETLGKLSQLTRLCDEDVLFVSNYGENLGKEDVNVSALAEFNETIVRDDKEKYYLYLIRKPQTNTAAKSEPCDRGASY
jgi:hypothetical protein